MHAQAAERIRDALGLSGDGSRADAQTLADQLAATADRLRTDTLREVMAWGLGLLTGDLVPGAMNPGWLRAYAHCAGAADGRRQRYLFARALAFEALRPGTIQVRTLHLLAAMDDADLALLDRLARLACADFIVKTDDAMPERTGLGLLEQDLALEAGLLHPDAGRAKVFHSQQEDRFIAHVPYRDKVLRIEHPLAQRPLTVPCLRLTRAGDELCRIAVVEEDFDHLMRVTAFIRGMGYKVTQATVTGRDIDPNVIRHMGFSEIVPLPRP